MSLPVRLKLMALSVGWIAAATGIATARDALTPPPPSQKLQPVDENDKHAPPERRRDKADRRSADKPTFAKPVPKRVPAKRQLPRGFVDLADIAPSIEVDMRYAGGFNFVGSPVDGYSANRCVLARPVAMALARVQQSLQGEGLGLRVYDCYRPVRAVRHFLRWARRGGAGTAPGRATKYFYPRIRRSQVIPRGYVAERSSHSRGTAVDLTLVNKGEGAGEKRGRPSTIEAVLTATPAATCLSPSLGRDNRLDMGTAWDCFDVKSHTFAPGIAHQARANRRRLFDAMKGAGFRNYKREWWHYSMSLPGYRRGRDFPVE